MAIFLGFFKNRRNGEDFVVPVDADHHGEAMMMLGQSYPSPHYVMLTVYARREIETILSGIDRWPGLPSKIQPPAEDLMAKLSNVRVQQGGLPPMPKAQADGGRVETVQEKIAQVRAMVRGQTDEVQALTAQLTASARAPQGGTVKAAPAPAVEPERTPRAASLIEVLKGLRSHA